MADTATTTRPPEEVITLRPSRGWIALNLRDLWRYRELAYFLTWRDVIVRYKQTLLGAGWAVLQPLFNMVVLSVIFGEFAKMPTGGIPRRPWPEAFRSSCGRTSCTHLGVAEPGPVS